MDDDRMWEKILWSVLSLPIFVFQFLSVLFFQLNGNTIESFRLFLSIRYFNKFVH